MLVKVSPLSDESVHFWNYERFKEHHKAKVKSWDTMILTLKLIKL